MSLPDDGLNRLRCQGWIEQRPARGREGSVLTHRTVPAIFRDMPLFTRENARDMQLRAAAAKANRKAEGVAARLNPPLAATLATDETDQYRNTRLMRVRSHLNRLDEMLADEDDPQALERLSRAIASLSKQEQELAGRPLPGSLKPSKASNPRPGRSISPIDVDISPEPVGISAQSETSNPA